MTDTQKQEDSLPSPLVPPVVMAARGLGYGGLIPFLFLGAANLLALRTPFAPPSALLIGYGAVILSFVGALHWGAQLTASQPEARRLIWSVLPALLAWVSLMMPLSYATSALIAGLLVCFIYDWGVLSKGQWPAYMKPLRVILTLCACLSLATNYLVG